MNLRHVTASLLILTLGLALPSVGLRAQSHPVHGLIWQNTGQVEPIGAGLAIAVSNDVVVASGNVCTASFNCDWFVRAMNPDTGATRWEDRVITPAFDHSQGVVIDGGRVIASGWLTGPPIPVTRTGRLDFVVRAYDAASGTLLWQQRIDRGTSDVAESLAAADGRIFAVGRVRGASGGSDFTIVAFDAATGTELWESVTDAFQFDDAFVVAADRDGVFVAGPVRNETALLVRAHDAQTGAIRWEDEILNGRMTFVQPNRLATEAGVLYLAGAIVSPRGDQDALVRAYDERSGAIRWTQQWDGGGNDEAFGLATKGNQLFVVGEDGMNADFLAGFRSVRALDRKTGRVQWLDSFQLAPGGDAFAASVLLDDDVVFTGGAAQDATGEYVWSLRTYDAQTGTLRDHDEGDLGGINALAGRNGRVYATGFLGTFNTPVFAVRAYRNVPRGEF